MEYHVALPSKPRIISEEGFSGVYEIDGLYPGYGHTLGNSLRRIILSSLPGAAITTVKIEDVPHEFSTIEGVQEDVITILLNLKKVRLALQGEEPQIMRLRVKGPSVVTAASFETGSQISILNPEQHIAEITKKNTELSIEVTVEKGLGYVAREVIQEGKVDIGIIALDASFTPIRRANYEVENMRVGDRTDFNRLRLHLETDGTITPRDALEHSIKIMVEQLRAVIGFKEEEVPVETSETVETETVPNSPKRDSVDTTEIMKTRIETLDLSARTIHSLTESGIRTIGGLARKKEEDILGIEGIGVKGLQEIRRALSQFGITLK